MRTSKRRMNFMTKKRLHARRIVRVCKAIAHKDISDQLSRLIEEHIVEKLPSSLMRRLAAGDCGRPMREAMKLTIPFLA